MHNLSLLICSLANRKDSLDRLLTVLGPQLVEGVQVIINSDGGKKSVGQKRNELLDSAIGRYVSFIDDDDLISDDYVSLILDAIKNNCDVVGIHLLMTTDGEKECRICHSLKYDKWWDEKDPDRPGLRRYFRNPNHLNPVKRELASVVRFSDKDRREDHDYSKRLLPLLKTETYIEKPVYYYQARSRK